MIGMERHESRHVDWQLRMRYDRQGDPVCSKNFVFLEDSLMQIFASAGLIIQLLQDTFKEREIFAHPLLNWSIEISK
jgi:preprotein translocase subunit SecA